MLKTVVLHNIFVVETVTICLFDECTVQKTAFPAVWKHMYAIMEDFKTHLASPGVWEMFGLWMQLFGRSALATSCRDRLLIEMQKCVLLGFPLNWCIIEAVKHFAHVYLNRSLLPAGKLPQTLQVWLTSKALGGFILSTFCNKKILFWEGAIFHY